MLIGKDIKDEERKKYKKFKRKSLCISEKKLKIKKGVINNCL